MKRILILDRFYFPDEQPTSVYLTELTEALKDQFQFEVLCGTSAAVTQRDVFIHRVPSLKLPKRNLLLRLWSDLSFLSNALLAGLFLTPPDLIVSQTSPPGMGWVGFLLSRWHRARWVQICQDLFPFFSGLERVDTFLLKQADRVIVIGEDMRQRLLRRGLGASRVMTIRNWVDLEFIRPLSKKNAFSEKYRLGGKFVVLYAGNFGRIHNFDDLLAAARTLEEDREIVFVLVGEGALKERLIGESRALANVLIVPFEPRSRVPEVLAAADVSLVLLKEGNAGFSLPSKVYSLLASGRPILACVDSQSDVARMVNESDAGLVVPPGHPEALMRAVKELYARPGLRDRLGWNARRFAEEENFQARAFHSYAEVFKGVLNGKRETAF